MNKTIKKLISLNKDILRQLLITIVVLIIVVAGGNFIVKAFTEPTQSPQDWAPTTGTNPIAVSNKSASVGTWKTQLSYCSNLNEGGYTNWRMPSAEELSYAIGEFGLSDSVDLWTRTVVPSQSKYWVVIRPSDGYWCGDMYDNNVDGYVRCVR